MKESIGLTFTFNIIIIFLIVAFVFIIGTLSYTKAFKASSIIINALERYEGYNELSRVEIENKLSSIGYSYGNSSSCRETRKSIDGEGKLQVIDSQIEGNQVYIKENERHNYCIYYFEEPDDPRHYSYGIVTYMQFDFYMFGMKLKLPLYTRTRRTFKFNIKKIDNTLEG